MLLMPHLPHFSRAWAPVGMALWFVIQKATVFDLSDLNIIMGDTVRDCLREIHMTEEVAADRMHLDVSAFRKMLRGEGNRQIGIARLLALGVPFMAAFTPMLMFHCVKLHSAQMLDDAREAAKALGFRKAG